MQIIRRYIYASLFLGFTYHGQLSRFVAVGMSGRHTQLAVHIAGVRPVQQQHLAVQVAQQQENRKQYRWRSVQCAILLR
jgi:hypothetical protein